MPTPRAADIRIAEKYVLAFDRLVASGYKLPDDLYRIMDHLRKKIAELKGESDPVNS